MEELERMSKRLIRIEKMLAEVLAKSAPAVITKKLTEKEVIVEYGVSKHVLRRLRLGYKRSDGMDVPAVLFQWRHLNGRNFVYEREELERVLRKAVI